MCKNLSKTSKILKNNPTGNNSIPINKKNHNNSKMHHLKPNKDLNLTKNLSSQTISISTVSIKTPIILTWKIPKKNKTNHINAKISSLKLKITSIIKISTNKTLSHANNMNLIIISSIKILKTANH